jgi:hypothetical protein
MGCDWQCEGMEVEYLSHGCVVNESVNVNDRGLWKVETVYARVYDHARAHVYAHGRARVYAHGRARVYAHVHDRVRDRGHGHDHCYGYGYDVPRAKANASGRRSQLLNARKSWNVTQILASVEANENASESANAHVNVNGIYRRGMAMGKRNVNVNDHVQTLAREELAHESGQNDLHYVKNANGHGSVNVRLPEEYLKTILKL